MRDDGFLEVKFRKDCLGKEEPLEVFRTENKSNIIEVLISYLASR